MKTMHPKIEELYKKSIEQTEKYHKKNKKAKQKELDYYCACVFSEFVVQECASIAKETIFEF